MQSIREFHEHHAHVTDHRKQEFSITFGLRNLAGFENIGDFRGPIDDIGYFCAKLFAYFFDLICRIFHNIVEQGSNNRNIVERNFLRDDHRDFERMDKIRLTGSAPVVLMCLVT